MENKMACYTVWILVVALFVACSAQSEEEEDEHKACQNAVCGLDTTCFHKYNVTTEQLDAVCVPNHGFLATNDIVSMNEHVHYKKQCPSIKKIGPNGDRLDCGPDRYVDKCSDDSNCNDVSTMCCFDGCRQRCRQYWLTAHP